MFLALLCESGTANIAYAKVAVDEQVRRVSDCVPPPAPSSPQAKYSLRYFFAKNRNALYAAAPLSQKVALCYKLVAVKEVYEERIKDIKASSEEYLNSLKKDKKIMMIIICVLSVFLICALLLDLFIGTIGWVRF